MGAELAIVIEAKGPNQKSQVAIVLKVGDRIE
jgi:hypothetical protein